MPIFAGFHLILAFKLIFRFTFTENPALVGSKPIFQITFTVFDPDCVLLRPREPVLPFILYFILIELIKWSHAKRIDR